MCSTYNEGKSVVTGRFIETLKNKIYKQMAAVSKIFYFDVLDDIIQQYTHIYNYTFFKLVFLPYGKE